MQKERSTSLLGLALAAAVVALPVEAQDRPQQPQQQQQQQACTIQPAQVQAGSEAERVTVTLNRPGAEITGLEAPEGSNIELASEENIPRTPLAGADQPRPEPISMGEAENQWVVYLNLSDAEAGSHELTFTLGGQGQPGAQAQQPRQPQPDQPEPVQPDRPDQPTQPGQTGQASQCTARIMVQ